MSCRDGQKLFLTDSGFFQRSPPQILVLESLSSRLLAAFLALDAKVTELGKYSFLFPGNLW